MKDQIVLTGIHGFGYHGVFDHERKDGQDFFVDLTLGVDLTVPSNSDAIGYIYRKGKKNILSFLTTDEIACGARPEHLRNQEFVCNRFGVHHFHYDVVEYSLFKTMPVKPVTVFIKICLHVPLTCVMVNTS